MRRFLNCAVDQDVSGECEDLRICVGQDTTFHHIVRLLFPSRLIVSQSTSENIVQGLVDDDCNVIASGIAVVASEGVRAAGFDGDYEVAPQLYSKDPLALVTRQDDPQWSAFVASMVSATFYAEEMGIFQNDTSRMPETNLFGGLLSRMFRNGIDAVGNYGEIYERNLGSTIPRQNLNLLNKSPFGPQHYPYPGIVA